MNAGISSGKPAQTMREDAECTARAAAQRKSGLSHRGGWSAGQTVAFSMVPFLFALLMIPLGLAVSAPAEPSKLVGEALRQAVSGKTVLIATPIGSFPIRYNSNGTMTGRAPAFVASVGTKRASLPALVPMARRQTILLQAGACGPTVYWLRDDGLSGTATIASP
jgi:hypothetical protein